jgi:hypothetical protein
MGALMPPAHVEAVMAPAQPLIERLNLMARRLTDDTTVGAARCHDNPSLIDPNEIPL